MLNGIRIKTAQKATARISSDTAVLRGIAQHDWPAVFEAEPVPRVLVTGHAMLEKFLQPYKSMTAQVLLVEGDAESPGGPSAALIGALDRQLASAVLDRRTLRSTADLSPLPLCGLRGWWPGPQDRAFYADSRVFRPLPSERRPAAVLRF